MKNRKVNLHINQKRTLLIMAFFSLISFLICFFIGISIGTDCEQLNSLLNSNYEYSVITNEPIGQDDYYQYNAGIYFSLEKDSQTSLNVDVVMQTKDSSYTDNINWNTNVIGNGEVAITKGIAKSNDLKVGDKLYSKHIVDGSVQEYIISQIILDAMNVRASKLRNYSKGIIVMGYDSGYANNVSRINLVFTNMSINDLSSFAPENIIYREDEISDVYRRIIPYVGVELILTILLCIGLSLFLTKDIEHNFKRQIMLGFEKKKLDAACFRFIYTVGMISILISFMISVLGTVVIGACKIEIVLLVLIGVIEILAMLLSAFLLNKRLWRR